MTTTYPKAILADGETVTVHDAIEEAMWTGEYRPPQGSDAQTDPEDYRSPPNPEPTPDEAPEEKPTKSKKKSGD